MRRAKIVGELGVTFAILFAIEAQAATVPTFTSGPAVASYTNINAFPNTSTFVFGYQNGYPMILNYAGSGVPWNMFTGHHMTIVGGYDGDPAATYVNPQGPSNKIMICGHAATGPGYMYCVRGYWDAGVSGHFLTDQDPYPVGAGTFNPGSSPVLVNQRAGNPFIDLFARGTDNQIWYAVNQNWGSGTVWNGWWQLPPPPSDSFVSDPAATVYASGFGNESVIVCARLASNQQLACTFQDGSQPSGWTSWFPVSPVSGEPSYYKPALTRTATSVDLFGMTGGSIQDEFNGFPFGGGTWGGGWTLLSGGNSFLSGPAAIASQIGSHSLMTIARGGESGFWYAVGYDNLGTMSWSAWKEIQANLLN